MFGQEMENVRVKYEEDSTFRSLVSTMEGMIATGQVSMHELRQAATYAGIRYELWHMKPLLITPPKN